MVPNSYRLNTELIGRFTFKDTMVYREHSRDLILFRTYGSINRSHAMISAYTYATTGVIIQSKLNNYQHPKRQTALQSFSGQCHAQASVKK